MRSQSVQAKVGLESPRRALLIVAPAVAALVMLFAPQRAHAVECGAQCTSGLKLTLVARECPSYQDVAANRARNNIMESLEDLGPDTLYKAGEPISNEIEVKQQPLCTPITGWKFTLGTGYKTKAVSGYWGALSIITGQLREPVETLAQTPLLNGLGQPTGKEIAGAVTIELGKREAELAKGSSALWVQGGTPADPILAEKFPEQYGFAALRCAIDNLNGDNVEWVGYPTGQRHVLCYAYYVKPPPTAGTITIVKKAVGASSGSKETFDFGGNVSYNPGGKFSLTTAPPSNEAQESFVRGANRIPASRVARRSIFEPWLVNENPPANWVLKSISCTVESELGRQVLMSTWEVELEKHQVAIGLAPREHVTCTFEDEFIPPPGKLTVRKVTKGGTGTFAFAVNPATGKGQTIDLAATTLEEGLAADATPSPELAPGQYTIAETSKPAKARGTWTETAIGCSDGTSYAPGKPATVTVPSEKTLACTYTNELKPTASLVLRKQTEGGTGLFGFTIQSELLPGQQPLISQSADVTREKESFLATGDPSNALFFEPYLVQEVAPPVAGGHWAIVEVNCDGTQLPFSDGRVMVRLAESDPHRNCLFVNRFTKTPEPPEPENETAQVAIAKRPERATIALGERAAYDIKVTNHGPATARDVVVDDQMYGHVTFVSAQPSQGSCTRHLPLHCLLGTIANGRHATVRVIVIPHHTGYYPNRAVAGLANPNPAFGGSVAHARVRVHARRKRPRPIVTG